MVYTHNVLIWSIRYRIRLDVRGHMQLQAKIHTHILHESHLDLFKGLVLAVVIL